MKKEKAFCYMLISVFDDLPLAVFDTFAEVQQYLGCSSSTLARMLRYGITYDYKTVEKILL